MGCPDGFLETRAIVKHGNYALIPEASREKTTLPQVEGVEVSILASPKMGASSLFYSATVLPGGRTVGMICEDEIERFLYVHTGCGLSVRIAGEQHVLSPRSYVFIPAGTAYEFENTGAESVRILLYKKRYIPLVGHMAEVVVSNLDTAARIPNSGMDNAYHRDLLPKHLGFDMTFMTLEFEPDASHGFIETHVEEHCAYVLSGQGFYYLGAEWIQVKAGDFMWMGPFTPQGTYTTGRKIFSYIYSKECNRDEVL